MAAVKFMLSRKHMHRPALALRDTRRTAGQFRHDQIGINAICQHVPMVAIARDDAVFARCQRGLESDGDGFLADVQMAKSTDQAQAV